MSQRIRERVSALFAGQSGRATIGSESLCITAILRNLRKILLVPEPHIEDILLLEPFILSMRESYPDATLAMLTTVRLAPLAGQMDALDVVLHSDGTGAPGGKRRLEELGRDLSRHSFDAALALSYEADPAVLQLTAHSGARLRIGSVSMGEDDESLNILVRESEPDEPYWMKMRSIFSIIDVEPRSGYTSRLSPKVSDRSRSLDFLRDRHGEGVVGFLFDQVDPLDRLEGDELANTMRTVMNRRSEKTVLSGFGLGQREVRPFIAAGGRYLEKDTIGELVELFADCSWTITNSLGLAVLIGGCGSRVIFAGKPSRLKKCPLAGLETVAFLPVTSGKVLVESLLRVMEEKYPGE